MPLWRTVPSDPIIMICIQHQLDVTWVKLGADKSASAESKPNFVDVSNIVGEQEGSIVDKTLQVISGEPWECSENDATFLCLIFKEPRK